MSFFICDLIFDVMLCNRIVHGYHPYVGWKKYLEFINLI